MRCRAVHADGLLSCGDLTGKAFADICKRGWVLVESTTEEGDTTLVRARSVAGTAACPLCGNASGRIHSRYERHVSDLPCAGRRLRLRIAARRYVCAVGSCRRKVFAERFGGALAGAASAAHDAPGGEARIVLDGFQDMIRSRATDDLEAWLQKAEASLMASFARGISKDLAAVHAAIASPWSNGQTEEQVNGLKLVKRQMYGRAKVDLLEARLIGA